MDSRLPNELIFIYLKLSYPQKEYSKTKFGTVICNLNISQKLDMLLANMKTVALHCKFAAIFYMCICNILIEL